MKVQTHAQSYFNIFCGKIQVILRKRDRKLIILGIDPGLATLGYGVLEKDARGNVAARDYGVVLTPKEERLPTRLAILEEGLNKLLDKCCPDEVAVEEGCPACASPTAMHIEQVQDMLVAVCNADRNHLYKLDKARVINAVMESEYKRSGLAYTPLELEKEEGIGEEEGAPAAEQSDTAQSVQNDTKQSQTVSAESQTASAESQDKALKEGESSQSDTPKAE